MAIDRNLLSGGTTMLLLKLLEEKDMGRTIFLSSHIFEEMEKTCDRVGMLVGGHLAAVETVPDGKEQRLEDIFMHYYGGEEHA